MAPRRQLTVPSSLITAPLPGECLYSIAAHHAAKWFAGTTPGAATLIGSKTTYARDFVGCLNQLALQFDPSSRLTGEQLALRHTALPIHLPFFDGHVRHRLLECACSGGSLQLALGIAPSRLTSARALRLCPQCVATDRREHGRAYWHREHQLAGVLVCPHHGTTPLAHTSVRPDWHFGRGKFVTPEQATIAGSRALTDDDHRRLLPIAQDTLWLLCHEVASPGCNRLHAYYRNLARKAGYSQSNGSVALARLRAAIETHYGRALLERIGCGVSRRGGDWVAALLRKPRAHQQPLRHLLLTRFFGLSIERALAEAAATDVIVTASHLHVNRIKRDARLTKLLPLKREQWLKALDNGRDSARERAPTLYCWLWRNDRDWLRQHRGRNHIRQADYPKWAARDAYLARRVQEVAIGLRGSASVPRISRNVIAVKMGCPAWLVRDHPLLPGTVIAIRAVSEGPVEYALRRINRYVQEHGRAGLPWRVRVACGISTALATKPTVAAALKAASVTPLAPTASEIAAGSPHEP